MRSLLRRLRAAVAGWRLSPNQQGALWSVLGSVTFTLTGAIIKTLGDHLSSFEIMFGRSFVLLMLVVPVMARSGLRGFRARQPGLMLLRAGLVAAGVALTFYAFTRMALADATAISFTRALFTTVLAIVFLGEVVGLHRWAATIVGFGGAVLMLRPGGHGIDLAAVAALVGAMANAGTQVVIRKVSRSEDMTTIMIYPAVMVCLVSLPPTIWLWVTPTWADVMLILALGLVSVSGQAFMIRAFRVGEASAIASLDYVRLLLATAIGILWFSEVPDTYTIVGSLIIILSTLYSMRREGARGGGSGGAPPADGPGR